jgi:ribosomal protein S18
MTSKKMKKTCRLQQWATKESEILKKNYGKFISLLNKYRVSNKRIMHQDDHQNSNQYQKENNQGAGEGF